MRATMRSEHRCADSDDRDGGDARHDGRALRGGALTSYAGAAPANADELAAAHKPFPRRFPPRKPGRSPTCGSFSPTSTEIAPGVKYAAWAWAGAPGPVIHVRQVSSSRSR